MRHLAIIERKNLLGGRLLRLLCKQTEEYTWLPVRGEIQTELANHLNPGALVFAHITANNQLGRVELATEPLVEVLHRFTDYVRHFANTGDEIETWRESLRLQSDELRRREAALAKRENREPSPTVSSEPVIPKTVPSEPPVPAVSSDPDKLGEEFGRRRSIPLYRRGKYTVNVMEKLVAEEVEFQLTRLPGEDQSKVDRTDTEAWALNRLPARYATGKQGIKYLEAELLKSYGAVIVSVVSAGLQAVLSNQQPPDEAACPVLETEFLSTSVDELLNDLRTQSPRPQSSPPDF